MRMLHDLREHPVAEQVPLVEVLPPATGFVTGAPEPEMLRPELRPLLVAGIARSVLTVIVHEAEEAANGADDRCGV